MKDEGGVEKMEENSKLKSQAVYEAIQKSNGFYQYVYYMTCTHKKSTSPDVCLLYEFIGLTCVHYIMNSIL